MSVHKDKDRGLWYFAYRDDNGKQRTKKNKEWIRKRDAVQAEAEFKASRKHRVSSFIDSTFIQVSEMYLDYISMHQKPSSVTKSKGMLEKHIDPFFNNTKIIKITSLSVEQFQKQLIDKVYIEKGKSMYYSNSYLKKVQQQAKLVFDYAVRHQIIISNPFDKLEYAKHRKVTKKHEYILLKYDQYLDFINVLEDLRKNDPKYTHEKYLTDKALYSILYWCGLRIGEIAALSIYHYNRESKIIHVQYNWDFKNQVLTAPKNNSERYVDVPDVCAVDIENLLNCYEEIEHTDQFPLIGFVKRMPYTTYNRDRLTYTKLAKLPNATFHDFRHTHVSTLIQLGMRDIDIAKRLGHSVKEVNERYGHLFPVDKENLLYKLNNIKKYI